MKRVCAEHPCVCTWASLCASKYGEAFWTRGLKTSIFYRYHEIHVAFCCGVFFCSYLAFLQITSLPPLFLPLTSTPVVETTRVQLGLRHIHDEHAFVRCANTQFCDWLCSIMRYFGVMYPLPSATWPVSYQLFQNVSCFWPHLIPLLIIRSH